MFLNCSFLAATFHEELALLYGDVPEPLIDFVNKVYTGGLGAGANDMQTPVTTALLLLLSGAARGKPLGPFVRSIDTNPWPDDKKLNCVIKKTLAKAKDKTEYFRFKSSEHPEDVAACMRRELKDPYVFMPKLPQGGNRKKARVAAEDAPDRAIASSSGASIGGVREGGDVGLLVSPRATWPRVPAAWGSSEGFVGGSGGSSRTDDHGLTDHHACAQADSALRPPARLSRSPPGACARRRARGKCATILLAQTSPHYLASLLFFARAWSSLVAFV